MAVPRKTDPGSFTRTSTVYQTGGAVPRSSGGSSTPAPTSSSPTTTAASTPTVSFQDAVLAYQKANAVSAQSYEALFPYLKNLGYQVERPTHAGGTLQSDDKIVNQATGEVFDLISDVGGPNMGWTYGAAGYWVNGAPSSTPPGGTTTGTSQPTGPNGANPPHNGNPRNAPTTGHAVPRGTPPGSYQASTTYGAAYAAQSKMRHQANTGGRQAGIFAGFQPGRPLTNPQTLIGS